MHRTHIDRTLRTYNQQAIDAWKAELVTIPYEIEQSNKTIEEHEGQWRVYEPQLQQLKAGTIMPLERKILGLQSKINVMIIPAQLHELRQKINPYSDKLDFIKPQIAEVTSTIVALDADIGRLETMIEISESREAQDKLLGDINASLEQISSLQGKLDEMKSARLEIRTKIAKEREDLNRLRADAKILELNPDLVTPKPSSSIVTLENKLAAHQQKLQTNSTSIDELENKISGCRRKVSELRGSFDEYKNRIRRLEQKIQGYHYFDGVILLKANLEAKRNEKRPYEEKKAALERECRENKHQLDLLQQEITRQENEFYRSQTLAGNLDNAQTIVYLRAELDEVVAARTGIGKQEAWLEDKIASHKHAIASAKILIKSKESRLDTLLADKFMVDLRDHPDALVKDFIDLLRASFENYEDTHPVNQPDNIRLCLVETISKLNKMEGLPHNQNPRQNYYQLCGMLWEMLDKADGGLDISLAEVIMDIFKKHPVDPQEAKTAYETLRSQYLDIFTDIKWCDYIGLQRDAFTNAVSKLEAELFRPPHVGSAPSAKLRMRGFELLQSVTELRRQTEARDEKKFDIKFYTTVLDKTAALVRDPGDYILRQKYHKLIEVNSDGVSSTVKKVSGSMLMILSASLLAARFALSRFTLSGLTPSVPVAVASSGFAFLFGAGLFGLGTQKSTARSMTRFEQSALDAGNERNTRLGQG